MSQRNKLYRRQFSFNVFRENADELLDALKYISDPEHGLRLMSQNNRDAGGQAHKEITRYLHNFVASALSLIDHARVIMLVYKNTEVQKWHEDYVERKFKYDPLTKFVQDLRNYMLHKSLPPSEMFIEVKKAENGGHTMTSGVRLSSIELLQWSKWTAPAKKYLTTVGEHVEIENFVKQYVDNATEFEQRLTEELHQYHSEDIRDMEQVCDRYNDLISRGSAVVPEQVSRSIENINPDSRRSAYILVDADEINAIGRDLAALIKALDAAPRAPDAFASQRPVPVRITPKEMIGEPLFTGVDRDGGPIMIFSMLQGEPKGFDASGLDALRQAASSLLQSDWVAALLGAERANEIIIDWCREQAAGLHSKGLADFVMSAARESLVRVECFFPIDNLEVESSST